MHLIVVRFDPLAHGRLHGHTKNVDDIHYKVWLALTGEENLARERQLRLTVI